MARKVQTHLIDDLDGSDAAETITFALDNRSYEIDLNETHALELRAALAPFIAVAARLGSRSVVNPIEPRADKPRKSGKPSKRAAQEVRDWARSQGIEVGDKGRLSADLLARYEAALRGDALRAIQRNKELEESESESEVTVGVDEVRTVAIPESGEVDLMGALQNAIRRNQELGITAESEVTVGVDEVRTVAIPESDDWDDETVEIANSPEVRTLIPAFQSV